jgi:3-oxoacyl-[acyl-carrier protein] reductase
VAEPLINKQRLITMRKKIIVLGGSSGIGKATAQRFAKEGWQVLVASNDLSQCLTTVNELEGEDHIACEVDVCNEQHLHQLEQTVKDKLGSFDALINSIGFAKPCSH